MSGSRSWLRGVVVLGVLTSLAALPSVARGEDKPCPGGMVLLPGGSFTSAYKQKKPVTVTALCIDAREVTVTQYAACVKGGKCAPVAKGEDCNSGNGKRANHPVNCLDWSQANAYCAAQGKRLPTVDEWEWAARGAAAGTRFPWGNAKPVKQVCWYKKGKEVSEDTGSSTCTVGMPKTDVTPQGVFGLGGNVAEWTATPGFKPEKDRFVAGGSGWSSGDPDEVSASSRTFYPMSEHAKDFGVRCVVSAPAGK